MFADKLSLEYPSQGAGLSRLASSSIAVPVKMLAVLQNLPKTSDAFTEVRPAVVESSVDNESSPRKTARISGFPDISHSRKDKGRASDGGPKRLQVINLTRLSWSLN